MGRKMQEIAAFDDVQIQHSCFALQIRTSIHRAYCYKLRLHISNLAMSLLLACLDGNAVSLAGFLRWLARDA